MSVAMYALLDRMPWQNPNTLQWFQAYRGDTGGIHIVRVTSEEARTWFIENKKPLPDSLREGQTENEFGVVCP